MSGAAGKSLDKGPTAQASVSARDRVSARPGSAHDALIALQRAAGNRAVTSLLAGSSGQPLDSATRAEMESRFTEDFSDVRVHADGAAAISAAAIGANAWTSGRDIAFGEGFYSPRTSGGKKLLAHELAHVVQQRRGGSKPSTFETKSTAERDAASAAGQSA